MREEILRDLREQVVVAYEDGEGDMEFLVDLIWDANYDTIVANLDNEEIEDLKYDLEDSCY